MITSICYFQIRYYVKKSNTVISPLLWQWCVAAAWGKKSGLTRETSFSMNSLSFKEIISLTVNSAPYMPKFCLWETLYILLSLKRIPPLRALSEFTMTGFRIWGSHWPDNGLVALKIYNSEQASGPPSGLILLKSHHLLSVSYTHLTLPTNREV